MIDDGIFLLQDGGLLAAWKFQGPDLGSATNGEMAALSGRLGTLLRLGGGWMVQFESDYYLSLTYLPPVAREEKIKGWMFEGVKDQRGNATRIVDYFKSRIG